jgi:hypothetical protein
MRSSTTVVGDASVLAGIQTACVELRSAVRWLLASLGSHVLMRSDLSKLESLPLGFDPLKPGDAKTAIDDGILTVASQTSHTVPVPRMKRPA